MADVVRASSPSRIDLAGGLLDLYPLYLLLGQATTVNLAINLACHAEVRLVDGQQIHLRHGEAEATVDCGDLPDEHALALTARTIERVWSGGGLEVTTRSDAPRGAGLGASAALLVSVARATCQLEGRDTNPHQLVQTLSEVEAGLTGIPTGRQDFYAAMFGGLQHIEFSPGRVRRRAIPLTRRLSEWFDQGLVLAFVGEAHFSSRPAWDVVKAAVDGDADVRQRLVEINEAAEEVARALEDGRWDGLCAALRRDWAARQELHAQASSPRLDALVGIALEAGAEAAKLCGAGGGGALVALCPPQSTQTVRTALSRAGAEPLEVAIDRNGCILTTPTD